MIGVSSEPFVPAAALPAVTPAASPARRILVLAGAIALMLAIHLLPVPAAFERGGVSVALSVEGKACLAILAFAVTLWVTETLPFVPGGEVAGISTAAV